MQVRQPQTAVNMTFWNEYATVEKDGERLATFPDLIMTINAKTGEPVTTAMMEEGLDVYVITTDKKNLKHFADHVCSRNC